MTELEEIVDAALERWQQPEEKITIRDLLLRVAMEVADRMLDPVAVGRQIGQLAAERDHARSEREMMRIERDEAFEAAAARAKQLTKFVAEVEEARRRHFEAMRRKQIEADSLRADVEMLNEQKHALELELASVKERERAAWAFGDGMELDCDEARKLARSYYQGLLRCDWYEWHEEMVLADCAKDLEEHPWLGDDDE